MPAYVIFIRERTLDQSELDAYAQMAPPSLEGWRIKFLAALAARTCSRERSPRVWRSPSFRRWKEARRWYDSPAYQAAAQHRFKGGTYRGLIVEGV